MTRTRIPSSRIESFCRYRNDEVLVVLRERNFRFCGRTLLRSFQCDLEGVEELSPQEFLKRYPDMRQVAAYRALELILTDSEKGDEMADVEVSLHTGEPTDDNEVVCPTYRRARLSGDDSFYIYDDCVNFSAEFAESPGISQASHVRLLKKGVFQAGGRIASKFFCAGVMKVEAYVQCKDLLQSVGNSANPPGYGGKCRNCGSFDEYPERGADGMVLCWKCA